MEVLENPAGAEPMALFRPRALRAPAAPPTLESLREDVARCRSCPLVRGGHACGFGRGPRNARLMLVGEQPGGPDDRAGRPFAGPAGPARPGAGRGRHRPRAGLPHPCGQAFQVHGARVAARRSAPGVARGHRLPIVARPRDRAGEAGADRGAGCRRRAGATRPQHRRRLRPRQVYALPSCVSVTVTARPLGHPAQPGPRPRRRRL